MYFLFKFFFVVKKVDYFAGFAVYPVFSCRGSFPLSYFLYDFIFFASWTGHTYCHAVEDTTHTQSLRDSDTDAGGIGLKPELELRLKLEF